jgi:hypothetical protein
MPLSRARRFAAIHAARCEIETEIVPAATRSLIVAAVDLQSCKPAVQQRTHAAMADERGGGIGPLGQRGSHRRDNSVLGVDRTFPAAHRAIRLGKEPIRRRFKLRWWEEARGRTIILVHLCTRFRRQPQRCGQDSRRLRCFGLVTGYHALNASRPWHRSHGHGTRPTNWREPPLRDRDGRIDQHLRMCDVDVHEPTPARCTRSRCRRAAASRRPARKCAPVGPSGSSARRSR